MQAFFSGLSGFELALFIVASAATLILAIQIILSLLGLSGSDADIDSSFDAGGDNADIGAGGDLAIFTVKGIIAFFAVGGWVGLGISLGGAHIAWVIVGAFLSGTAALFGIAFLIKALLKLQSNGVLVYDKAVGGEAEVYLTIPPKGMGKGKINLTIQERYIEAEAVTDSGEAIPTGSSVKIKGYINGTYIVEKINI